MHQSNYQDMSVLYAEDDENDVFFAQRIFRTGKIPASLHVVPDGQEAIDYLAGQGAYADRAAHPLPQLLLLDVSMPVRSGLEVLAWVRQQPALKELPVVIYSSSNLEPDQKRARELGANDYLVKPMDLAGATELLRRTVVRWTGVS